MLPAFSVGQYSPLAGGSIRNRAALGCTPVFVIVCDWLEL